VPKRSAGGGYVEDADIKALLKQHNTKHAPKPTYVPAMHSVRDVRAWEQASGKSWQALSPAAKDKANAEISAAKSNR
jgi:hypothetical protein